MREVSCAPTANLMSSMIRASDDAKTESTGQDSMKTSQASSLRANLTDDEIWGNLFIYNLAGHETTASTLAYAIALLACHPEWQEWLQPELSEVFGVGEADEDQYDETFPRMKRCHAILVRNSGCRLKFGTYVSCLDDYLVDLTLTAVCS